MKLYEVRYLRDEIINEGMLDRVPARFRKIVGGIVAAILLTAPQPAGEVELKQQAKDAAQSVQALSAEQYQDLMSSIQRIKPIIKKPLEDEGIKVDPVINHIANMSPQELAAELSKEEHSGWTQHTVDSKTLMLKPTVLKKAEYAIEYFVAKGMARHAAIGLVGGFLQESMLDEHAVNSNSGAYGIAQWLGDRKEGVPDTFKGQLDHVWNELQQRPHSTTYSMLSNANTLGRLVYASNRYERFKGWQQGGRGDLTGTEHGDRTEYIRLLARMFGKDDEVARKIATAKPLQQSV